MKRIRNVAPKIEKNEEFSKLFDPHSDAYFLFYVS